MVSHLSQPPSATIAVRLLAAGGVTVALAAGIVVLGRVSDDFRVSVLLTTLWFAVVLVAGALVARRRSGLRLPLAIGYGAVAAAAGVLLVLPMLTDRVVNESVVTAAAPASAAPAAPAGTAPAANVEVASGSFASIAHEGSGTAAVVKLAGGGQMLTLTAFETSNGPDLRVYLSTGDPAGGGELGDFKDLGGLKGNKGTQQYEIPDGVDVGRFATVVIWCRAFSVGFTSAKLAAS